MAWAPFRTVRARMMLLLAGVVCSSAMAVAAVGIGVGSRAARQSFEASARSLTGQIAAAARVAVSAADPVELRRFFTPTIADPTIDGLAVFDDEATELVDLWESGLAAPLPIEPFVRDALRSPKIAAVQTHRGFLVIAPVLTQPLDLDASDPAAILLGALEHGPAGALALHFSTSALEKAQVQIQWIAAISALTLGVLLGAVGFSVGNRLTRPLLELASRVSRGPPLASDLEPTIDEPIELASLKAAIRQAHRDSERHLRALEGSERRARAVFDATRDAMAIVDAGGEILNANPALREHLTETADTHVEPLHLPGAFESSEDLDEAVSRALRDGTVEIPDVILVTDPNDLRHGGLVLSRLGIPGTPLVLALFRDETERLREDERRRYLEDQLRHSQKLEALGVMAGGIAHDFNNQLNIMLGNLVMLWQDLGREHTSAPLLEDLELATRRCIELTQGLRTFTRRERSHIRPFSLQALVDQTLRLLTRTLPSTVQVSWDCDESVPNVLGDSSQIQQVLMNLCINATDAMHDGGTLSVSCGTKEFTPVEAAAHPHAAPGQWVVLRVVDAGHGMDTDTLSKAFDPFFTTKAPGHGTGLGLSTAFGIVRSHGGWIDAESTVGQGSKFRVWLPATSLCVDPDLGRTPTARGGTETILVAEDDARLRELTRAMLIRSGYQVIAANDGHEALALYRLHGQKIQLLVLDLVMPTMGGNAVLRRIRSERDPVPVLLTSGYEANQELTHLLADHAASFLPKPYSPEDLARKVREMLDEHRPAAKGEDDAPKLRGRSDL